MRMTQEGVLYHLSITSYEPLHNTWLTHNKYITN